MATLAEIKSQSASTLVCGQLVCPACAVVDHDWDRMRCGHLCTTCGTPSEAGRLYFPINIHILVDLMQQAYHSRSPNGPLDGPQGRDVGTILYFCTLREALLNHFLVQMLRAQKVPASLIERLLDDNRLASQKFGNLFASVVGQKWDNAVDQASRRMATNFSPVSHLMRRAAEIRNRFLHEGSAWTVTRDLSTECMNSASLMVQLFVAFHNEFIHSLSSAAPNKTMEPTR
jgi:hypothetical protein